MSLVMDGDEEAHGSLEGQAELLTGQPHGGSVHDGHQLLSVLRQQLVEQLLVSTQKIY